MRRNVFIAVALAFHALAAFTLDDVHYWVGVGENAAGVAICWEGSTKVWGFRWNSEANVRDAVSAVVAEDSRLRADDALSAFSYDVFQGADALVGGQGFTCSVAASSSAFPSASAFSPVSLAAAVPSDGWIIFRAPSLASYWEPVAAETPYGWKVVEWATEATASYNKPAVVLGPPTRSMTVPSIGLPSGAEGEKAGTYVISPVYPAWLGGRLFTISGCDGELPEEEDADVEANNNFITIEFDHDVVDDPGNPFGLDFIVFGNSCCSIRTRTSSITPNSNPSDCLLAGTDNGERAVVEVAQDKDGPWYGSMKWRTSDGFAPTLGHCYDPENPDTTLYAGNEWWGAPTNPTYPVDPRVDFSDCDGLTLAELCQRYNGSAGGTGYDLADAIDEDGNELPADAAHGGRKWFRYVKISCTSEKKYDEDGDWDGDWLSSEPEVDAVADVAPVSGYRNWVCDNFTWDKAWQTNLTDAAAIASNGLPNGLNFVYGLAPTDQVAANVPFKVMSFEPGDAEHVMTMLSPTQMTATPNGLVVKETSSLGGGWKSVKPTLVSSESQGDGTWLNTFTVPKGEGVFFKFALDAE